MNAIVEGKCIRSELQDTRTKTGGKIYKTSVDTGQKNLKTDVISTLKEYNPGEDIIIKVNVTASIFNNKEYLNCRELED